jgi:hypothetical protein
LTGQTWDLRLEVAAGTNGTAPPATSVAAAPSPPANHHPLVQSAIDVLGARLLKVDDGFGQAITVVDDAENPAAEDGEEQ